MASDGYDDPRSAETYDLFSPWDERSDLAFYLDLLMAADSVLDIGCGTGTLLRRAREAGHGGRLCGLEPAAAMLEHARVRADIEWVAGDMSTVDWHDEFDLVVMTGHAFQELVDDDAVRTTLSGARNALTNNGRLVFETRNPAARAWERWTPEHASEVLDATGATLRVSYDAHLSAGTDVVELVETMTNTHWDHPMVTEGRLRFLDATRLAAFLGGAGLAIDKQYGNWDRTPFTDTSPEIITFAALAHQPSSPTGMPLHP